MLLKKNILSFIFYFIVILVQAQTGTIKGRVFNELNNEPIAFANVLIEPHKGALTDENGNYRIENIKPGVYNIQCSFLGFQKKSFFEITITSSKTNILNIPLKEETEALSEVLVTTEKVSNSKKALLSSYKINATEISRNPGGNRDISKVLQILPGVSSTLSFRNDIIVRGGAPNENRFFLDGIEIPNINHFATQGSSGGPVGMINVNFIRSVDFYSGAFPANRGNALSSVIDFNQINGNDEKLSGNLILGSSDLGISLDGPIGNKSVFIFSFRRSYLKMLFKALKLPFLPTYNDFQFKTLTNINNKNQITILGLGAIDDFELNKNVNEDIEDLEMLKRNQYLLNNLPVNKQRNYVLGAKWTHFSDRSFQTLIVSRNYLKNEAIKYRDNINEIDRLLLNYDSSEAENKLRFESTVQLNKWNWNVGSGFENALYTNKTYQYKTVNDEAIIIDFDSKLNFQKYSFFTQFESPYFKDKLKFIFGIRTDFNDYSAKMSNPIEQLSPRVSFTYKIDNRLSVNFNIGQFYQLPSYTVLGYRNRENVLINKKELTYIRSNHIVGGVEYLFSDYAKFCLEGFYKTYNNYPFLVNEQISLANLGGDFGVIGNDPITSTSKGRSYGLEILLQQKLSSSIYGLMSYTFVRSEFKNNKNIYVPSSWDNRHILNITAGKKLSRNWEVGLKFRYLGGAPYTPYDNDLSAKKEVWNVIQQGVTNWEKLNEMRNPASHGLDIRIDKKWYFKKTSLNAYVDIQNIYNSKIRTQDYLDVERDDMGNLIEDPNYSDRYLLSSIENTSGTILPSIGLMFEF